jgi:hypothetical protein
MLISSGLAIRERIIRDENGERQSIREKLICYWSKKHYDKEMHENEKFIEYLDSVIAHPDKLKDKPRKIEQFLIKKSIGVTRWTIPSLPKPLTTYGGL